MHPGTWGEEQPHHTDLKLSTLICVYSIPRWGDLCIGVIYVLYSLAGGGCGFHLEDMSVKQMW